MWPTTPIQSVLPARHQRSNLELLNCERHWAYINDNSMPVKVILFCLYCNQLS
jgi:hypothetical protein